MSLTEKPELEERFLEEVSDHAFKDKRNGLVKKTFFQLRFNPRNREQTLGEIAEAMNKQLGEEYEGKIKDIAQRAVLTLKNHYEKEIRADGIDPGLWSVGRGGKVEGVEGRVSPWQEAYDWLWTKKYAQWVWDRLIEQAREAGEQITLTEVNSSADRDPALPRSPKNVALKDEPYQLWIDLKQDGFLLVLGQWTSGQKCCYCPSQAFAVTTQKLSGSTATVLPDRKSLAAKSKTYFAFQDEGKEWVLVIITPEQLNLGWTGVGGMEMVHKLTANCLVDLWRQLEQQPDAELFYKVFEIAN